VRNELPSSDLEDDEYQPPYRLCALILVIALAGCGALIWLQRGQADRATAAVSAMSAASGDLKQVIRLKEIYSKPPEPEDPSQYRQKSPSDRRPEHLRSL
jgi:hypothetical protein